MASEEAETRQYWADVARLKREEEERRAAAEAARIAALERLADMQKAADERKALRHSNTSVRHSQALAVSSSSYPLTVVAHAHTLLHSPELLALQVASSSAQGAEQGPEEGYVSGEED